MPLKYFNLFILATYKVEYIYDPESIISLEMIKKEQLYEKEKYGFNGFNIIIIIYKY